MQDQLILSIRLRDDVTFNNFYEGDNQEVVHFLRTTLATFCPFNYIFLYGSQEVGKSHLLQACCHYASSCRLTPFYLPLNHELSPLILEDLDHYSVICIDNIELIAGQSNWEEAIFHFYNDVIAQKRKLIIAGAKLPSRLGIVLPDLASRLASGVTFRIKPLSDRQKLVALQRRATIRGFDLPDEVGCYLLNHYPRNMMALFELLEILDIASLKAQQQRLTIPFVKSVLIKKS
jgi:DnaA-homolog protein